MTLVNHHLKGTSLTQSLIGLMTHKKMVQKQGDGVVTPRIGFGYLSSQPVKKSRGRKDICNHSHYTSW